MNNMTSQFLSDTGATVPIVCGPMYPGSNPELIAAVSNTGAYSVVQPVALTALYGHDFREGLRLIQKTTDKPFGVNFTIFGGANKKYHEQMQEWMQISIEEGVKFFLTSLGKPTEIVKIAHQNGIKVYHDVPNRKVALAMRDAGVDGINCINWRGGGQTGIQSAEDIGHKDHLVLHYDDDVNLREKTGTWSFPLTGCVYYPPGLSFEGGDLAIYTDGEDSTPELIKSRGNRLVIFDPGKVLHCVQKVTKGTRMGIAINLWEVEPWSVQKGYMLLD